MKRKEYGARHDQSWRQSVKDYSPNGGRVHRRERRRKATISIIQDSDIAPNGWSYITVGERWNGRGSYVDLFLAELAASPPERNQEWSVRYGDFSEDIVAIYLELKEYRVVQRDKLQYSVNVELSYTGHAVSIVREKLREFAPGWYDVTVCRTEESRDLAWNTLHLACERVAGWLRVYLHDWKRQKMGMLSLLDEAGEIVGDQPIYDGVARGYITDSEERFMVQWCIHHNIEKPPEWQMFATPGNTVVSTPVIESAASDPLQAREQIASFLSKLNVTRPIEFGGRRRIEE